MFYTEKVEEVNEWFSTWVSRIPQEQKSQVIDLLDNVMFYLSNFFQQRERTLELERKIILEARLFDSTIDQLEDMEKLSLHQLEYLEEKWKTKYTMYSMIEGGIAGIGHPLFLLADLPALLAINMKMIQSIAGSYGYSLTSPTEQILSLQVLNAASLSKKLHADVMHWLEENHLDEAEAFLSHRQGTIIQPEWLETLAKQWIKSLVLYGMKKTTKHSFSILGIALGANLNYQFTKNVAQFSSQFYRQRYLKSNGRDEFGEYERA